MGSGASLTHLKFRSIPRRSGALCALVCGLTASPERCSRDGLLAGTRTHLLRVLAL